MKANETLNVQTMTDDELQEAYAECYEIISNSRIANWPLKQAAREDEAKIKAEIKRRSI